MKAVLTYLGRMLSLSPAPLGKQFEKSCIVTRMIQVPACAENGWRQSRKLEDHTLYWYDTQPDGTPVFVTYSGYGYRIHAELARQGHEVEVRDFTPCGLPDPDLTRLQGISWRGSQSEVVCKLLANRCGVIDCPTGWGKSFIIRMIVRAYPNSRIGITVPSTDVAKEIYESLVPELGYSVGIVGGGKHKPRRVTVAVTHSLLKLDPNINLLMTDECFVGDTLVSTPRGPVTIDSVRSGDTVCVATGTGQVQATSVRQTLEVCHVAFTDGSSVTTTPSHPFFTERGWVRAGELEVGQSLFRKEDVCVLRSGVLPGVPLGEKGARAHVETANVLLELLRKEVQEPDAQPRVTRKDGAQVIGDRASAMCSRGEREGDVRSASSLIGCAGGGLVTGVRCSNKETKELQVSRSLQDRHCEPGYDDSVGNRREFSPIVISPETGFEEGDVSDCIRVASVTLEKLSSPRVVFNLAVSGHPSYYAGGVLVHNCHAVLTPNFIDMFNRFPRAKFQGFTATPKGRSDGADGFMEALFGPVIHHVHYQEAVESGNICQLRYRVYESDIGPVTSGMTNKVAKDRVALWRNKARNALIAHAVRRAEITEAPDPQILIMVEKTEHAFLLQQVLPDFVVVTGEVDDEREADLRRRGAMKGTQSAPSKDDCARMKKEFSAGTLRKVIATYKWSKGVNFLGLDVLVRAEGASTEIASGQVPGRLSRKGHDGKKEYGLLIDFNDVFSPDMKARSANRFKVYKRNGWIYEVGS